MPATDSASSDIDDDDYEDTGLYDFIGPLAQLPDLDGDAPEPSPAEHAHHLEYIRRRDWAANVLWRAEREAERDRRQAEFRAMRDAWLKRPANDNRSAQASRFDLTWFADIDTTQVKKTFVKGVFGDGEFTMASGLPGTGKSAIITDAACHVAAGMEWHGRKVRQGFVVYIAAERKKLTERRMAAFRKRHGVGKIPLLIMGGFIDMTSANLDTKAIIAAVRQAEALCGQTCIWVIIDTLTRVFGPGDQNASKDMGRFVANCDLLLKETGAHVTVIHHTAWSGERGKGAIDLDGAVDASFMVKKQAGGSYVLECDGANDAEAGVVTAFRMESVTVGQDEDGNPTTAPVIVPDDTKEAADAFVAAMSSGYTGKALDVLRELRRWGGLVDLDDWRRGFYDAYLGEKPGTLKTRFLRAREALLGAGTVAQRDGGFIIVQDGTSGTCAASVPCAANEVGINRDGTNGTQSLDCADVPLSVPVKREEEGRGLDPDEGLEGDVAKTPDIGVAEADPVGVGYRVGDAHDPGEMVVVDAEHHDPGYFRTKYPGEIGNAHLGANVAAIDVPRPSRLEGLGEAGEDSGEASFLAHGEEGVRVSDGNAETNQLEDDGEARPARRDASGKLDEAPDPVLIDDDELTPDQIPAFLKKSRTAAIPAMERHS